MIALRICSIKLLFTASNFVMPFAALFIAKHYSLETAATAVWVTVFSLCYLGGNLAGGYVGDKFQSRKLLRVFALSSTLCILVSILTNSALAGLGVLSIFSCMAGAASPVLSNYLSNSVGEWDREKAFGNLYLAHNLGIAVVFVVGGFLLDRSTVYPLHFFGVVSVLCCLGTLALTQDDQQPRTATAQNIHNSSLRLPILLLGSFVLFFGLAFLDAQREYQLPVWLQTLNAANSASWFGTIGIINAVVVLLMTRHIVRWCEGRSPILNMGLAGLFYAVGFGLYFLFSGFYAVLTLVVVWSIGEIIGATYMNVFISKNAPAQYRAKLFSLIPVVLTLGKILSISTTTAVAARFNIDTGWLLAAAVGIASAFFSLALGRSTIKAHRHDKARHTATTL